MEAARQNEFQGSRVEDLEGAPWMETLIDDMERFQ